MRTLLELFDRMEKLGSREAVRLSTSYRSRSLTYADVCRQARAFAAELTRRGVGAGDRFILWSENRLEWAAAFWGGQLAGAVVVPIDWQSSVDLVRRIADRVDAKLAVCGDEVDCAALAGLATMSIGAIDALPPAVAPRRVAEPDEIVEIVFTSGSTAEPKGVIHRQRHICANLTPIEHEIDRYVKWARPLQPLRVLDLLPLSHLFGQSMGLYIAPLLGGAVVFTGDLSGPAVMRTLKREKIWFLVGVPAILDTLRRAVEPLIPEPPSAPKRSGVRGLAEAWWAHRDVHAETGRRFLAFVVGGARLDLDLERFWRRLGYVVVQGYGLTEASPVVALNHPFSTRLGSLGKPVPGQEVRLAADGEILVRGASVATEFLGDEGRTAGRIEQGWLHTGDIGYFDQEGRLYYRGRKGDLIVTSAGLNVYPQDIEAALAHQSEIREAVVVGLAGAGGVRIHAALVPETPAGFDAKEVVARVNRELEPSQRVQEHSVWAEEDIPRTSGTRKVRRNELARLLLERGASAEPAAPRDAVEALLGRALPSGAESLSDDLGLSSLEKVELLAAAEQRLGASLDEATFAKAATVSDLRKILEQPSSEERLSGVERALLEPRWTRRAPMRTLRRLLLRPVVFPLLDQLIDLTVDGLEYLDQLQPPVIFAANHTSHLDTVVLARALPPDWRYRLAPAMSQDYFADLFSPRRGRRAETLRAAGGYFLALTLFSAFPLPQKMAGVRRALRYAGEAADAGWSILIFPEGTRSPTGELLAFQPGVALLGRTLGLPIVPVGLRGVFEVYSAQDRIPHPGPVSVRIGPAVRREANESDRDLARRVEQAVRSLAVPK